MTTTTKSYPFLSKAQVIARVETDDAFMVQCLGIMYDRQTESEQEKKTTEAKNRAGFMSSHAVNGSILAVKARGEGLTAEENDKARSIVVRYGKQLASHFRGEALAADPTLKETAAIFGV